MNKSYCFLLLTIVIGLYFIPTTISGQGFYVQVNGGYGFPSASQDLGSDIHFTYTSTATNYTTSRNEKQNIYSFGEGLTFGAGVGYSFSQHFSVELNGSYLSSASHDIDYEYLTNNLEAGTTSSTTSKVSYSASMLRLIPCIRMQLDAGSWTPYFKAGIVLGISPSIKTSDLTDDKFADGMTLMDTLYQTKTTYSGGTSIGYLGAIGLDKKFSEKISVFGELSIISQSWAPNHKKFTEYTKAGVDLLPQLNTYQKETDFVDEYSYTTGSNNPIDTTVPSKDLKYYWPFSSLGIQVGVRFSLNGNL